LQKLWRMVELNAMVTKLHKLLYGYDLSLAVKGLPTRDLAVGQ
jgi:hypothetical protein